MIEEPTELEILRSQYKKELEKWDVLGVDLASLSPTGGLLQQAMRLDAIIELLIDKEITTTDEMDMYFLKRSLAFLPEMRAQIEPVVTQARLEALRNGHLRKH